MNVGEDFGIRSTKEGESMFFFRKEEIGMWRSNNFILKFVGDFWLT